MPARLVSGGVRSTSEGVTSFEVTSDDAFKSDTQTKDGMNSHHPVIIEEDMFQSQSVAAGNKLPEIPA